MSEGSARTGDCVIELLVAGLREAAEQEDGSSRGAAGTPGTSGASTRLSGNSNEAKGKGCGQG